MLSESYHDLVAQAQMTLEAEMDSSTTAPDVETPVIPEDCMEHFQREWRQRPRMRALITVAGRMLKDDVKGSKVAMALWEMSRSYEWQVEDARGLLIDMPEFKMLA